MRALSLALAILGFWLALSGDGRSSKKPANARPISGEAAMFRAN